MNMRTERDHLGEKMNLGGTAVGLPDEENRYDVEKIREALSNA
jgi:hypothetical protein